MQVFLHSGGPLGPVGRAALPDFFGPRRRVAFVTAANLDAVSYTQLTLPTKRIV
jgi:hypothetical protein